MNCKLARQIFSLHIYGELSMKEEARLEQHLNECDGCRRELEREKAIHQACDQVQVAPAADLLERCRKEFPSVLHADSELAPKSFGWRERIYALFHPAPRYTTAWLKLAGAVALVAVGFFGARFTAVQSSSSELAYSDADPVTTRVRHLEPTASGEVRVVVDQTRQQVVSGTLEDESIQRLLLTAMRDPSDPGLRAESVDLLKSRRDSEEIRKAFLLALQNDPSPGVRLKALEGLGSYSEDPESRRVLSQVLFYDDNPGIRTRAIDLLISSNQDEVVGTLQELLRYENDNYLRSRSQEALRAMNASVETF